MHPGDVRMLLAVDICELRGHRNCVLFSRQGYRPEADKMSGSDLDGDQFAITWDERLFLREWNGCTKSRDGKFYSRDNQCLSMSCSTIERDANILSATNAVAMDFDGGAVSPSPSRSIPQPVLPTDNLSELVVRVCGLATSLPRSVPQSFPPPDNRSLSEALIKHFMNHIKLASVGRICTLWLDHAVRDSAGGSSCLELARLHSIAVDYPKSGIPAVIPRELHLPRGEPRAHWRELKGRLSFHCESIIGKLYDEVIHHTKSRLDHNTAALAGRKRDKYGSIVCNSEVACGMLNARLKAVYNGNIRILLGLSIDTGLPLLNEDMQLFADQQRSLYEGEYLELMNKYGIRSEGEVATGCMRKFNKLQKKRQHEFAEEVRRRVREIRQRFRVGFFRKVLQLARKECELADYHDNIRTSARQTEEGAESDDSEDEEDEEYLDENEEDILWSEQEYDTDEDEVDEDGVDEDVAWVERVATARGAHVVVDKPGASRPFGQDCIRRWAGHLAAAYYEATYSPELRWRFRDHTVLLFSFPWVVAGDVIACQMVKWSLNRQIGEPHQLSTA